MNTQHLINKCHDTFILVNNAVKGKYVKIITDFRDQPVGCSKPSLKDKVKMVEYANVNNSQIWLQLSDMRMMIEIDKVKFL